MIKDVTDLEVYNLSLNLLEPVYLIVRTLPPEHRKVKYQVTEAAEKIAPQIAEGFGKKNSAREFCRFLSMALGSSDEVITHLREITIIARLHSGINVTKTEELIEQYKVLSKRINKLLAAWRKFT